MEKRNAQYNLMGEISGVSLQHTKHCGTYLNNTQNHDCIGRKMCCMVHIHKHIGMHNSAADTDGFHSIFSLWQLEGITSPRCLLIATHDLFGQVFNTQTCNGEGQWNRSGQKSRFQHQGYAKAKGSITGPPGFISI